MTCLVDVPFRNKLMVAECDPVVSEGSEIVYGGIVQGTVHLIIQNFESGFAECLGVHPETSGQVCNAYCLFGIAAHQPQGYFRLQLRRFARTALLS